MKVIAALISTLLISTTFAQEDSCNVPYSQRIDCGYMGIDQGECQGRGCCWVPANSSIETMKRFLQQSDVPWCFYPSGSGLCENFEFTGNGQGFENSYDTMYTNFMANIDIDNKGGVCASPDPNTPGGSYFYHWMRDGALSMRAFMRLNNYELSKIQPHMDAYLSWVHNVQNEYDPNNINVLIEPKFDLPNGEPYTGGWCRPQTDGPALRSGALIQYANVLLENGQEDQVTSTLFTSNNDGLIQVDLNWILSGWDSNGCDLWEEVQSTDFFWNRMAFYQTLTWGAELATKLGSSDLAAQYSSLAAQIKPTIMAHWNGQYIIESTNREKDSAVIHALVELNEGLFDITGPQVAATVDTLNTLFCVMFQINQNDDKAGTPGILYGRYEGDTYAGGNPWQLLTAALAAVFYQGAEQMLEKGTQTLTSAEYQQWTSLLDLPSNPTGNDFAKAAKNAGDGIMYRMWTHVQDGYADLAEQMSKYNGDQLSAEKLTWSFANVLQNIYLYGPDSDFAKKVNAL